MPSHRLISPADPSVTTDTQSFPYNTEPSTDVNRTLKTHTQAHTSTAAAVTRSGVLEKGKASDKAAIDSKDNETSTNYKCKVAVPEGLAQKTLESVGRNLWGDRYDEVRPALSPEERKRAIERFQEAIKRL